MMEEPMFFLSEKFNLLMNVESEDKARFREMIGWTEKAMELNVRVKFANHIIPNRGEIWTCHLGENIGSEVNKTRPVLIMQSEHGNLKSATTIAIPITKTEGQMATHVRLDDEGLEPTTNKVEGTILTEQIRCISKVRLGRKVAEVKPEILEKVENALRTSLGFPGMSLREAN